jgi:outer membrane receptor protein involved in Fe transport
VQSELTVDVLAKQNVTLHTKLEPERASLVVDADVRGALITVDGVARGFTPAVISTQVGPHVVQISQSGFRTFEQRVDLHPKEQLQIAGTMTTADEVIAASRTSESVDDAPASVTIITTQELRAMAYPTVADAVRGVRGLYLSDDRNYATIGVRGFSRPGDYGNRVLILLDGQPMNDNYISSSYVGYDGRVDIDDIERIEVVRGPGSVLYGTSAFFGVINLVTRSRQQPTHGEVAVFGADRDRLGRARVTGVVQLGKDSGMWMTASALSAAGADYYFPEYVSDPRNPMAELDANGRPADGNARNVDGFTAAMFTGRYWYKAFTVQWFVNSRKKTIPTGAYGTIFNDPRSHLTDTRAMIEARFEPHVSETTQVLTRVHANLYNFNDYLITPPQDGGAQHDVFRGRWGGVEQRIVFVPTPRLRATVGGEVIRHFQTRQAGGADDGPYVFDDAGNPGRDDPFTVAAGYALADITATSRVKISGGARVDYTSSLERFNAGSAINPRLAVIFKPYDGGNVKVMAGKAFRVPSVYELYASSPLQDRAVKLDPEQIYSAEVEYTHSFSALVRGTLAGYTNYVSDLVELQDRPGGRTQYANSPSPVQVFGGEAELRREWHGGWMLSATYSLQRARYLNTTELRDVPNSPVQLASAKGAVPIVGRALMAMTRLTIEGPRPDRNIHVTDPPQGTTDAGVIWDIMLSGETERLGVHYAIGAYNIMDWRYDAVPSGEFRQRTIVQSGRTLLASVSLSF